MVTLEKIYSSSFPNLYQSFLIDDDPLSTEQDWRNVFDYQFDNEEGYCGYSMLEDGEVVGMLGMVFSKRNIGGEHRKFCNLHTWWVREDQRGRSLALLRPVLQLDDYTVTHFTPCNTVRAITERLGFKDLNSQLKILLPIGAAGARGRDESSLVFDTSAIEACLGEDDRRIFLDHAPYRLGNLLIRSGGASCYVLYTHVIRHRLPYCHIHYISDKDVFLRMERAVRASLLSKHNAKFVALDARLVQDVKLSFSFDFWAPAHAVFKSRDVDPDQIDHLYSDVVFLKLTTLPDISYELRQIAHRYRRAFFMNAAPLRRAG